MGFGGPAAHVAMIEEEVVARRGWLTRDRFLDVVGATNLIPGPNSTEVAIHVGFIRAGWPGLIVAGGSFILPAVAVVTALAWVYVEFGRLPEVAALLQGVKPAVIAIILAAVIRLAPAAARDPWLAAIAVAVVAASLLGVNEVLALAGAGAASPALRRRGQRRPPGGGARALLAAAWGWPAGPAALHGIATAGAQAALAAAPAAAPLWKLGLFFLKVGSVLYGSGYVLVAFLEGGLVDTYGWLSREQLLDAIAVGQVTPGPVLTTATFAGYLVAGPAGAAVATLGIFLPSFVLVAALTPLIPRLRQWTWTAAVLDGVGAGSVALMAAVTVKLAGSALTGWPAVLVAGAAAVLGIRWKVSAAWLVAGSAAAGWLLSPWWP